MLLCLQHNIIMSTFVEKVVRSVKWRLRTANGHHLLKCLIECHGFWRNDEDMTKKTTHANHFMPCCSYIFFYLTSSSFRSPGDFFWRDPVSGTALFVFLSFSIWGFFLLFLEAPRITIIVPLNRRFNRRGGPLGGSHQSSLGKRMRRQTIDFWKLG